jgi:hypothetical protein
LGDIKNKKNGFITGIRTGRGITGTTAQRYKKYKSEILEAINWLNKDLIDWMGDLNHLERIIEENRNKIL